MSDQFTPAYPQNREPHVEGSYGAKWFMIDQLIKRISTATLVQVKSVTTTGEVAPIGQLDASPLVGMVDGANNVSQHGTVHSLAYFRLSAGNKAVIMDPVADDIGLAVICDRDIQSVKENYKASPPGSRRRFDLSDGIYLGSILNKNAPTSYVRFASDGTIEVSPDNGTTIVRVKAGEIDLITSDASVYVRPTRIDLGKKDAPHAVMTADGASLRVFAVIDEHGP